MSQNSIKIREDKLEPQEVEPNPRTETNSTLDTTIKASQKTDRRRNMRKWKKQDISKTQQKLLKSLDSTKNVEIQSEDDSESLVCLDTDVTTVTMKGTPNSEATQQQSHREHRRHQQLEQLREQLEQQKHTGDIDWKVMRLAESGYWQRLLDNDYNSDEQYELDSDEEDEVDSENQLEIVDFTEPELELWKSWLGEYFHDFQWDLEDIRSAISNELEEQP